MNAAKRNPDLMARLRSAQAALTRPIDIVTFGYLCEGREELERHVRYYEDMVAARPKRREGRVA